MPVPSVPSVPAQLEIRIVEARLVRIFDSLKPNQDVFVQLVCGYEDGSEKVVGRTEVCKNGNLAPRWNQRFLCGRDASKGGRTLKFKVHIDHVWRNPVLCGEAEFGLDNLWRRAGNAGNGRPQEVPVPLFKKGEQTGLLNISIALQGPAVGGPPAGGGYSTPVNQMNLDPYSPHSGPGYPWLERPADPSDPRMPSPYGGPQRGSTDFAASVGVQGAEQAAEQPGQVPRPASDSNARMQELRRREEQLRQQQWQEEQRQRAAQEQYRLQEQKLQEQREQEQRLQEQRLQEQRLQEQRMREQQLQPRDLRDHPKTGSYQMRDLHSGAPLPRLQYPQDPPGPSTPQAQLAPPNGDPSYATQRLGPETPSSFPATPQRLAPAGQPAEVRGVSCGWCKERSPKANLPLPSSPTALAPEGRSPTADVSPPPADTDPAVAAGQSGQQWWHSFIERG